MKYESGQRVVFQQRIYDFGYYSATGKCVLHLPGEPDMQSAIAVSPEEVTLAGGQMFAGVATIRAAIFDVIDGGHHLHVTEYEDWKFTDRDDDDETERRDDFVRAVVARIAELQSPPHDGLKLENLCSKHIKAALPAPSVGVCVQCEKERAADG